MKNTHFSCDKNSLRYSTSKWMLQLWKSLWSVFRENSRFESFLCRKYLLFLCIFFLPFVSRYVFFHYFCGYNSIHRDFLEEQGKSGGGKNLFRVYFFDLEELWLFWFFSFPSLEIRILYSLPIFSDFFWEQSLFSYLVRGMMSSLFFGSGNCIGSV